jgi:Ca-activated chloride channel family protein
MQLKTTIALSVFGMTLSSASIWALAPAAGAEPPPEPWSGPVVAVGTDAAAATATTAPPRATAQFSAGDTLAVAARLGHARLAADREHETFVLVDVEAEADAQGTAPVSLAIVLDRSGSMRGKRLANAMNAARQMIGRLRDGDTVSVVAYSESASVIVPPTALDRRTREEIAIEMRGIEASGRTCISCGIERAMALLAERPGAVSRMLLLSDGEANVGLRDVDDFRLQAARARASEVAISSIGVDVDYNERVLFAIAKGSNGRHYFVESPSGLPRIFDEEVQTLVRTVAGNARAEIELAAGVEPISVVDRAFVREGDRVEVPLGAFAPAQHKTVLLRVRVPRSELGERPIATVRVRWEDFARTGTGQAAGELVASVTERHTDELDPLVEDRIARAETVSGLFSANALFASGDVDGALREIRDVRSRVSRRKAAATPRLAGERQQAVSRDFDDQLRVLDEAGSSFDSAVRAEPAAPAKSVAGRRAVRANIGNADPFGQ